MNVERDLNVLIAHEDPSVGAGAIAVLSAQPGIRVLAGHADGTDKVLTLRRREHDIRRAMEAGVDGYLIQGCGRGFLSYVGSVPV